MGVLKYALTYDFDFYVVSAVFLHKAIKPFGIFCVQADAAMAGWFAKALYSVGAVHRVAAEKED